ncbi:COG1361 S-layer family protein [Geoglobus acetivorans]|uniref:S-layer domain protein n=1 Tax=Geoglobus acetivorans TaxID=565033 RepID=A0A0A7GGD4_GEOAI|nr:hypothetical protein GACE_2080 [Geoglobus acetivorans]
MMKMKGAGLMGLALLMLFTLIAPAIASNPLTVEYSIIPSVVKPGVEGYIEIMLSNTGITPIKDIYVFRVDADEPLVIKDYRKDVGDLSPGTSRTLIVRFAVPETAEAGYYLVKVDLRMRAAGSSERYVFEIPVEVREESLVGLSISPEKIEANTPVNLTLRVENAAGEIRNLRISWSGDGLIPLSESSPLLIPSMTQGDTEEFSLRVKALKQGTAVLVFNITYSDVTGNVVREVRTLALDVAAKKESFLNVSLTPGVLEVGNGGKLTFNLAAEGTDELKNILFSWRSDAIMPSSSNSRFIDALQPGERKVVTFDVFVNENVQPGYYPVEVMVEYDYSGMNVKSEESFSVMVTGDISLTATLFRAENDKVFISVANTGNAPAKNLVVYASSKYGKGEVFIGDMAPGDEEIIEVDQKNADTSKPYNITLKLEYRDVFGERYSEIREVNVHHFRESFSSAYLLGGASLLVLALAVIWFIRKK